MRGVRQIIFFVLLQVIAIGNSEAAVHCPGLQRSKNGADLIVINDRVVVRRGQEGSQTKLGLRLRNGIDGEGIKHLTLNQGEAGELLGFADSKDGRRLVVASHILPDNLWTILYFGADDTAFAAVVKGNDVSCTPVTLGDLGAIRSKIERRGIELRHAEAAIPHTDTILERLLGI